MQPKKLISKLLNQNHIKFFGDHEFEKYDLREKNIIYAGANSGMLHAINAKTGKEEWAFIPPFIAGILPSIINPGLDGEVGGSSVKAGGTNAIFGVDGSPVCLLYTSPSPRD